MIRKFFLTAKAWQLFVISFIYLFLIISLIFIESIPIVLENIILPLTSLFGLCWLYTLGVNLYRKFPSSNALLFIIFLASLFSLLLVLSFSSYLLKENAFIYLSFLNLHYFFFNLFCFKMARFS